MSNLTMPTATRWGIVWLAVTAGFVAAMQVGKVPPALPALRAELGLSMVAGGWVASLFSLVAASLGLLAGIAGDRVGGRQTLLLALACLAVGSMVGSYADGLVPLLAARLLESLGFVGVVVAAPALIVAATTADDRRLGVGLWSCYMPVGFALMLLAAPLLMPSLGWRGLWRLSVLLLAAFLLLFCYASRGLAAVPRPDSSRWDQLRLVIRQPGLWLLAFCFMLYSLQWFAMMTWLPNFLAEGGGLDAGGVALITALVVLVNAAGNLAGTWALQRGLPRWLLIAVSSLASAGIGGAVFSGLLPGSGQLWFAFAYSLISGITPAATLTGAVQHAPSPGHVAASNGVVVQGAQAGSLLGPPILALVVSGSGGWHQAPWLFAGASALSLLLAGLLRGVERNA